MLVVILVLAAIQLGAAWGCYALARHGGPLGFAIATMGGLLGFCVSMLMLFSPSLALQFVLLTLLGLGCTAWRAREKTFLWSGIAGSLIVIVVVGAWSAQRWSALRAAYPIESLADRLAYESRQRNPSQRHAAGILAASDDATLEHAASLPAQRQTELDQSYDQSRDWSSSYMGRVRTESLRRVHASHVEQFVESDGFGVGRMLRASPGAVNYVRSPAPLPLPGETVPEISADSEQGRNPLPVEPLAGSLRSAVQTLHRESLADFANPAGFGYIESRQRVAGFLPHAFSELPMLRGRPHWAVRKVELVSLLKHERPMVYVSANLPNMGELGDVPVRQLDPFEQRGLAVLLAGEDLEIERAAARIRMLGAIRAAKQCLECHTVDHGALLGAFSYQLRSTVAGDRPALEQGPAAPAL